MSSKNHYFFKGLLLFALFEILYEFSYFLGAGSNDVISLLEFMSEILGFICLIGYFLLGLIEIGKIKEN